MTPSNLDGGIKPYFGVLADASREEIRSFFDEMLRKRVVA